MFYLLCDYAHNLSLSRFADSDCGLRAILHIISVTHTNTIAIKRNSNKRRSEKRGNQMEKSFSKKGKTVGEDSAYLVLL